MAGHGRGFCSVRAPKARAAAAHALRRRRLSGFQPLAAARARSSKGSQTWGGLLTKGLEGKSQTGLNAKSKGTVQGAKEGHVFDGFKVALAGRAQALLSRAAAPCLLPAPKGARAPLGQGLPLAALPHARQIGRWLAEAGRLQGASAAHVRRAAAVAPPRSAAATSCSSWRCWQPLRTDTGLTGRPAAGWRGRGRCRLPPGLPPAAAPRAGAPGLCCPALPPVLRWLPPPAAPGCLAAPPERGSTVAPPAAATASTAAARLFPPGRLHVGCPAARPAGAAGSSAAQPVLPQPPATLAAS